MLCFNYLRLKWFWRCLWISLEWSTTSLLVWMGGWVEDWVGDWICLRIKLTPALIFFEIELSWGWAWQLFSLYLYCEVFSNHAISLSNKSAGYLQLLIIYTAKIMSPILTTVDGGGSKPWFKVQSLFKLNTFLSYSQQFKSIWFRCQW